jgi:membrane-bound serine protease (ClpP class)
MMAWVVLFFIAGMVLVLVEFLLPGMVLGTIGVGLLILSGVLGVKTHPDYALQIIAGELIGACLSVILGLVVLTRTRALRGTLTQSLSQQAADGYVSAESDLALIGREAEVITALRPAGSIRVDDRRIDAVSDGVFIEERRLVRIREVRGSRVVVDPIED